MIEINQIAALGVAAADARERLLQAMAKRAGVRRGLLARRQALARMLGEAALKLAVADPVDLAATLDRHERRGALASEPFLVVGLIASIRRVLVITLESSQAHEPGKWTPESQGLFSATMLELGVLAGLILVMVISIALLRRSHHVAAEGGK